MKVFAVTAVALLWVAGNVNAMENHAHDHGHAQHQEMVISEEHSHEPTATVPPAITFPEPTQADIARAFPTLETVEPHDHAQEGYYSLFNVSRLEAMLGGEGGSAWAGEASWGTAFNRMVLSSSGLREGGTTQEAEWQLYGSHAVNAWWSVSLGAAQQMGLGPSRHFATLGVHGDAEDFIETEATLYVGSSGQLGMKMEAAREFLLSNRLKLEPEIELVYWHKADAARMLGKGLSELAPGLQLRYEIQREFAPYLGVEWHRKLGDTASIRRAAGEEVSELHWVAGVRLWW